MHEHALMKGLIRQIEDIAKLYEAKAVKSVKVRVGALCHFTEEHFRNHFQSASVGTLADGAEILFEVYDDESDPDASSILLEECELRCPERVDEPSPRA